MLVVSQPLDAIHSTSYRKQCLDIKERHNMLAENSNYYYMAQMRVCAGTSFDYPYRS